VPESVARAFAGEPPRGTEQPHPAVVVAARSPTSRIAGAVLLDAPSFDLPEASIQRFHELLLGDDAALARCGLIVFFILRHFDHLLPGTVPTVLP